MSSSRIDGSVPRIFPSVADLAAFAGRDLGYSGWLTVDAQRAETFAAATGAPPSGSGDVVDGFLILSLLSPLLKQVYRVERVALAVNYGLNSLSFPSELRTGSRVRARARLLGSRPIPLGQQMTIEATIEREGDQQPVCVAEIVSVLVADGADDAKPTGAEGAT